MSVRDRILFPIEDHSVADANNVPGVRRRLQERNVAAGDLLIVTNTYRSANYVDHEGKPRDVYDFDRKFFINHDTLFTVEQVVDEGDRLVLGVVEYPGGGKFRISMVDVAGYAHVDVSVVGVDGESVHTPYGSELDWRYIVHVSRVESELIEQVCRVWDVQEGLVQTVNRSLPVVKSELLPPHQDLKVSLVFSLDGIVPQDRVLLLRLEAPVREAYDALLNCVDSLLEDYRHYLWWVERAADSNFAPAPTVGDPDRTLTLADGTVLYEGNFVATRFDYYKRPNKYLPPSNPRYVFVSRIDTINPKEQTATVTLDTSDTATLTLGEDGVPTIQYDDREHQLLDSLTLSLGETFAEAHDYVIWNYQAESRRTRLANLEDDHFSRYLTRIDTPTPPELDNYLNQLRTCGDVETAYHTAREAVLKQKTAKLKEVSTSELAQWRNLWNEYKALHSELYENLSRP